MNSKKLSSFYANLMKRSTHNISLIVDANDKVQRRVSSVQHLILPMLEEGALQDVRRGGWLPILLCERGTF